MQSASASKRRVDLKLRTSGRLWGLAATRRLDRLPAPMTDYRYRYSNPFRGREQAPASRVAPEQPPDERVARRLRTLLEADERAHRQRPITLPRLPSFECR